jgi:hypothetical protein
MEDQILDLVIIFESLHNTLTQLRRQCQDHCLRKLCIDCTCAGIVSEFEEQINETQMNLRKTEILHKRARSTAQLVRLRCFIVFARTLLIPHSSRIYSTTRIRRLLCWTNNCSMALWKKQRMRIARCEY